jgi:hypothetical protein
MTMNRNVNKFHTTIGELIVALSDAAFEVCAEKRVAYLLVTLALTHLLGRAQTKHQSRPGQRLHMRLARRRSLTRSRSNPSFAQAQVPRCQGIRSPYFVTVLKYWESSLSVTI